MQPEEPLLTSSTMTPACAMASAIFCVPSILQWNNLDQPKNFWTENGPVFRDVWSLMCGFQE